MPLLEARLVTHAYRRFPGRRHASLAGVSLTVERGQCWGVVGPNGSGKSTLLRILAGLALPLTGEVTLEGGQVPGTRAAQRRTSYVPETLRWPPNQTVVGALRELASLSSHKDLWPRIDRAARVVGLNALLQRRLGSLSAGQARRVVMAQALLDRPDLMLLDEPFGTLDSLVIHDVAAELRRRLDQGAAVVMASHRLEDHERLATHILVMRAGQILASGPAQDLLADVDRRSGLAALLGAAG